MPQLVRTVTLTNTTRRPPGPVVLHLPHEQVCARMGDCWCERRQVDVTTYDRKRGERSPVTLRRRFPDTLTLLAPGTKGSKVEGLPVAVLEASDVQRARLRGDIAVKIVERELKAEEPTPSAAPAPIQTPEPSAAPAPAPLPAQTPAAKAAPSKASAAPSKTPSPTSAPVREE